MQIISLEVSLTMLPVAVCIPVRNRNSPKARAMHRLRWTKLWSFWISSFLNIEWAATRQLSIDWNLSIVGHACLIWAWLTVVKWRRQCKRVNKGKKRCSQCMWCSPVDQQAGEKDGVHKIWPGQIVLAIEKDFKILMHYNSRLACTE